MSFKNVRKLVICLVVSFGIPGIADAGADSGFYLGAGTGNATVDNNSNFDASASAYKVFGGYNIGIVPLVDVAVEASYVNFGKPSTSLGSVEITGVDAFGLAGLSFGPFGLFAKAGLINWNSDSTIGSVNTSDSGTDSAYGIGARFAIGSFSVRAEYEVFNLDVDVNMVSISGVYTF